MRERLAAASTPTAEQKALRAKVSQLVALLGDDDFETRVRAEEGLEKIGPAAAADILRAARSPDAEVAYRAKRVAARLKVTATDAPFALIQALRVARILARAGTAEAKQLLTEMVAGDFGPHCATAAKPVLERWTKQ